MFVKLEKNLNLIISFILFLGGFSLILKEQKKDLSTESSTPLKHQRLNLPKFIESRINNQTQLLILKKESQYDKEIESLLRSNTKDFAQLFSFLYFSEFYNTYFILFKNTSQQPYLGIFKKHNNLLNLTSIYFVSDISPQKIMTLYGSFQFLSADEFYNKALKLADSNSDNQFY